MYFFFIYKTVFSLWSSQRSLYSVDKIPNANLELISLALYNQIDTPINLMTKMMVFSLNYFLGQVHSCVY